MKILNVNVLAFIKPLLIMILAFIAPIQWLLVGVGCLIALDTIAGLYRAYKLKQEITSKKFGHIVSKILLYNIAIMSGYIVQLMFGLSFLPMAKIIACAIGMTELKSITENVSEVTGIDLWKFINSYLKRNADDISKSMEDGIEGSKPDAPEPDLAAKESPSK